MPAACPATSTICSRRPTASARRSIAARRLACRSLPPSPRQSLTRRPRRAASIGATTASRSAATCRSPRSCSLSAPPTSRSASILTCAGCRPRSAALRQACEKVTEIRTIFKDLPAGTKNDGNIAVVVGNKDYQGDLPDNPDGSADADAVMALLIDQLGYKQENIIDLRDATLEDLERVFGSDKDPEGELAGRIDKKDPGDVFIYVASHGMVKEDDGKASLSPSRRRQARRSRQDRLSAPGALRPSRQDRCPHHHAHARGELRQEPRRADRPAEPA